MNDQILLEMVRKNMLIKIKEFHDQHTSNTTLDIGVKAGLKHCEVNLNKIIDAELEKLKNS